MRSIPLQLIEVRDMANSVVKTIKPPVVTNEIFYGGTASLILSSTSSVVLYDIQQQKTLAEITTPPVKYVVWSADGSLVALLSKHSELLSTRVIWFIFVMNVFHSNYHCQQELLATYPYSRNNPYQVRSMG